ncbi:MAG: DUF4214 domain-containing protein [Clostridiales bacterium]|nr:DUF4214 domain-containing protein [Clostridiales bacterium]
MKSKSRFSGVVSFLAAAAIVLAGFMPAKQVKAASDFTNVHFDNNTLWTNVDGTLCFKVGDTLHLSGQINNVSGTVSVNVNVKNSSGNSIRNINGTLSTSTYHPKTVYIEDSTPIYNQLKTSSWGVGNYTIKITATNNGYPRSHTVKVYVYASSVYTFVNRLYTEMGLSATVSTKHSFASWLAMRTLTGKDAALYICNTTKYTDGEFVRRLYWAMLGRQYDQAGYDYWLNCLRCGAKRSDIIEGFANSAEFKNYCSRMGVVAK